MSIVDKFLAGRGALLLALALATFAPVAIGASGDSPTISAGGNHTCAITTAGGAKCWGNNSNGAIGDGTTTNRLVATDVAGLTADAVAVAAGGSHSCALTQSGGVKCWGDNNFGQLGDHFVSRTQSPIDVTGLTSGVTAIAAGDAHTCALTTGGAVKCWGNNQFGTLGDGTTTGRDNPVTVTGLSSGVVAISAREQNTCALTSSGGMKCWGWNNYGQVGDGTQVNRSLPTDVQGLASGVASIATGWNNSCAVLTSGALKCWGRNAEGQVGDGGGADRLTPTNVSGLSTGVTGATIGAVHICALTTSGGVKCWGDNYYGTLGDNSTTRKSTPVDVSGLPSGIAAISAGYSHSCARTASGDVKCWGYNGHGEVGDGTTMDRLVPVDVLSTPSTYAITAGATPGVGGTVICSPNPVSHGGTATCTATANAGYTFSVFSGDCTGPTCTLTNVTSTKSVVATFAPSIYSITATASPSAGGTVTCSPSAVGYGGMSTCTVTPSMGYTASVGGSCGGALAGSTYTTSPVTAACTVVATFTQNTYTVTPSASANGSITPNTVQTIAHGATRQFTVTPNAGYTAAVGGTCGGTLAGNTYTTNPVTAACTVAASFTQDTYTVTPSAGANGSITPNTVQTIAHGATRQFTVAPNAGYTAAVSGTCGGNLVGSTYTTNVITANCTVAVTFTQKTYTVTPSAGTNGAITLSTPQTVAHGATRQFTVTPNDGYSAAVSGTCGGTLTGTKYVTNSIIADCTVAATFTPAATVDAYQALWWAGPKESGWGINTTHQGNILFATWFTYNANGEGQWFLMSRAERTAPGVFTGTIYTTRGPAFNAVPFDPRQVVATEVGTGTFTFSSRVAGTFDYTVNGITQSKTLSRIEFGNAIPECVAGGPAAAIVTYQDTWWNASESGWGLNITHQGDVIFATWFTYDTNGKPQWLLMSNVRRVGLGDQFTGSIYRARGNPFNTVPWNLGSIETTEVGTVTLTFSDRDRGTFAYTLDGVSQVKEITRQEFASPKATCRFP